MCKMAIKSRDDLMKIVLDAVAHFPPDYQTSLLEDVNDTLIDYDERMGTVKEWQDKYNALDETWKKKYQERFVQNPKINNADDMFKRGSDQEQSDEITADNITIDDLFERDDD